MKANPNMTVFACVCEHTCFERGKAKMMLSVHMYICAGKSDTRLEWTENTLKHKTGDMRKDDFAAVDKTVGWHFLQGVW